MNTKSAIIIVIDALGFDTLLHLISNYEGKIRIPFLRKSGLVELIPKNLKSKIYPKTSKISFNSYTTIIEQQSNTADSMIGHREMMGIIDKRTFSLFPNGFPKDYIRELEKKIGRKTIFNQMAGGIEAIEKNYKEHEKTGYPIVYASKCDPLIQIAMNEEIIPIQEQKKIADTALKLAIDMNIPLTRAIARSYIRKDDEIIRTANRYDAVLPLEKETLIDILNKHSVWTVSVGKTSDLVNTYYHEKIKITSKEFVDPKLNFKFIHPKEKDTNIFNIQGTINAIKEKNVVFRPNGTFIFTNLVDTDSLFGHTKDIKGSLKALEQIDYALEKIYLLTKDDDIIIITADHGMEYKPDYGYHSKERLFLITISKKKFYIQDIITEFKGLTVVGAIVAKHFNLLNEYRSIL